MINAMKFTMVTVTHNNNHAIKIDGLTSIIEEVQHEFLGITFDSKLSFK